MNKEIGQTIIMVTHEKSMAEYAKQIVHFVDGKIAGVETGGAVS